MQKRTRKRPFLHMSRPVSRVLSRTTIYLGPLLPMGSSHLPGTAGPACCPSTVLLRIEFTSPNCLQPARALLPHVSTLAPAARERYLSVALVRGSPLAGVTRYPCPMEPGLSSSTGFRPVSAVVRPAHTAGIVLNFKREVNKFSCKARGIAV